MSQICRYYLKGICKYGSRCHFLHENVEVSHKENYTGYSNGGSNDHHYSHKTSHYNKNASNYSRYHVDRRYNNQTETKSTSFLTEDEILDVIKQELREFEERHIWFLTVVAPLKDLGNIPGLKDFSPEEMRYQYYESCSSNSLQDFMQNFNIARNNVAQVCQMFRIKSKEAYETVRSMVQTSTKQNDEEMKGYQSSLASTFKFDLNSLSEPSPFVTQPVQTSEGQFSAMPVIVAPISGSTFSSGDFSGHSPNNFVSNQSPNIPAFGSSPNNDLTHQPNLAINSFSFNLNKLPPNQNALPSVFPSHPLDSKGPIFNNSNSNNSHAHNINTCLSVFDNQAFVSEAIDNSVFSKPNDLSSEALAEFQAKSFKISHIPLVPPTQELCFN